MYRTASKIGAHGEEAMTVFVYWVYKRIELE